MCTEHQGTEEYQSLRGDLAFLRSSLSSDDENAVRGAMNIIKDKVQQYIENSLKSKIAIDQIEKDLKSLCNQVVIPTMLWQWTIQKVTDAKERVINEASVSNSPLMPLEIRPNSPELSLFCKDTLHHASLCCDAINYATSHANVHTYFQSKNTHHKFTEVSFSQSQEITPYLIAVQEQVLYVAFKGETCLPKWADTASFDEG